MSRVVCLCQKNVPILKDIPLYIYVYKLIFILSLILMSSNYRKRGSFIGLNFRGFSEKHENFSYESFTPSILFPGLVPRKYYHENHM